jgi:hypothetical protein
VADPIVRVRIVAEDRARATIERVQESTRGLQTELRRLGVSLERDINANLQRNIATLEAARRAFEAGSISVRDFTLAQQRIGAQNEALRARLEGTGESARRASRGVQTFGSSLSAIALRIAAVAGVTTSLVAGFRRIVRETPQFQALADNLRGLAERFTTAASTAIDLSGAFDRAKTSASDFAASVDRVGSATGRAIANTVTFFDRALELGGKLTDFLRLTPADLSAKLSELEAKLGIFTSRNRESATAVDANAASIERLNRILTDEKLALTDVERLAKELGVTLSSQVSATIDSTAQSLDRARAAAHQGVIEWQDYNNLAAAASRRNAELQARVDGTADSLRDQAAASGEAAEGLSDYSEEQRRAGAENDRYAASARRAASAQAAFNAQVGGIVARSSGGQDRIDAAVAAGRRITLVQGGTRARILNGGSVLVGSG